MNEDQVLVSKSPNDDIEIYLASNPKAKLTIDFASGKNLHRLKYGGGKGQMIAKAVGISAKFKPYILDLTAGLGADAFTLASLGCKVDMVERNSLIYKMLQQALNKANDSEEADPIVKRMFLVNEDSLDYIKNSSNSYDIIYLDPMFEKSEKSARVKKGMQILRVLLDKDQDNSKDLLEVALNKAIYRVVVKRAKDSSFVGNIQPTSQILGKSNRFDIYNIKAVP